METGKKLPSARITLTDEQDIQTELFMDRVEREKERTGVHGGAILAQVYRGFMIVHCLPPEIAEEIALIMEKHGYTVPEKRRIGAKS